MHVFPAASALAHPCGARPVARARERQTGRGQRGRGHGDRNRSDDADEQDLLCREQARQAARTAPQLPGAARAAAARPSSAPPPRATVKLQDGSFAASSALTVHSTPTACSAPRSAPHGKARCSCAASCSSASRAGEPEGTTKCSNQRNDSSSMM
ncbi:unnamed protein product [Prorocentrum cordatum]|uniref:Uncharacterized protein n=1 Tax=Prorocentrum cordatum TaxID=2364126 RepID=A0ABN9X455_9DINO|nr:unnamed protein product [Polarella glacialis]